MLDCSRIFLVGDHARIWKEKIETVLPDTRIEIGTQDEVPSVAEDGYLVVFCLKDAAQNQSLGYRMNLEFGRQYVDVACLEMYLNKTYAGKRLMVAYGNCQVHDICDALAEIAEEDYQYEYINMTDLVSWKEKRLDILSEICDFFVYTKAPMDTRYRNGSSYIEKRNSKCIRQAIPCYEFRGYFPQTHMNVLLRSKFDILREMYSPFQREDVEVTGLLNSKDDREIIAAIKEEGYFRESQVKKNLIISLKQLEIIDKLSDIKIYEFVRDNYQFVRLFKDPCHFSDELVYFMARQLGKQLSVKVRTATEQKEIHPFTEIPIYPSVKKILNLKFGGAESEYELRMVDGRIRVSFDEFYEKYIEYARMVEKLMNHISVGRNDGESGTGKCDYSCI